MYSICIYPSSWTKVIEIYQKSELYPPVQLGPSGLPSQRTTHYTSPHHRIELVVRVVRALCLVHNVSVNVATRIDVQVEPKVVV